VIGPEHGEVPPRVAVARIVVEVLSATEIAMPGDASAAAVPWASGVPEQSDVAYSLTVELAAAEPTIFGEFWFAGEAGLVEVSAGAAGADVLTVNERVAGVVSTFFAASVAFTRKLCDPGASPVYDCGEVQGVNAAESRLQVNVDGDSLELNAKSAEVTPIVPLGPEVIVVSGAAESST
jgi:hypothetical protein